MVRIYTAKEAKALVGSRTCLACSVKRTVRKRSLNSTMAVQLVTLCSYLENPAAWSHIRMKEKPFVCVEGYAWVHAASLLPHVLIAGKPLDRECAKLRFWRMVRISPDIKEDGRKGSGYVSVTQRGLDFVHGVRSTHKFILTANHGVGLMGMVGEATFGIKDALGNHFNYNREIAQWSFERPESK